MLTRVNHRLFVEYHLLNQEPRRFDQLDTPKTVSILLSYVHSVFSYNRKREINVMSADSGREADVTDSIIRVIGPFFGVTE